MIDGTLGFKKAFAFGFIEAFLQLRDLALEDLCCYHTTRGAAHLFRSEGFRQIVYSAHLHSLDRRFEGGEGCDDNDADARLPTEDFGQYGESRFCLQPKVE